MTEPFIQPSPALPRLKPSPPQEITEAGPEPIGAISARIVGKLMAALQKDAA